MVECDSKFLSKIKECDSKFNILSLNSNHENPCDLIIYRYVILIICAFISSKMPRHQSIGKQKQICQKEILENGQNIY